ncbi:MAG: AAA family ATPase, partial [Candidatus Ranarchaeia archaeon]
NDFFSEEKNADKDLNEGKEEDDVSTLDPHSFLSIRPTEEEPRPSGVVALEDADAEAFVHVSKVAKEVLGECARVIVGKVGVLQKIYIALLAGGHVLLEGVPGVAKTFMANTFSKILGCSFKRIQFTPDLLPADIIGTTIFDQKTAEFRVRLGPVFANLVLADEINRAPPKTQAALLECMAEKTVTIEGVTHQLPSPFVVIATQNPIDLEGTYPLPEAQVDRFLFKIFVDYPTAKEEIELISRKNVPSDVTLGVITNPAELNAAKQAVRKVHIDATIMDYIGKIIQRTRRHPQILLGGSPRASLALLMGSKARAALLGRDFVTPDDVKALAYDVLNHRLILKPEAELEGVTAKGIIDRIVKDTPIPA